MWECPLPNVCWPFCWGLHSLTVILVHYLLRTQTTGFEIKSICSLNWMIGLICIENVCQLLITTVKTHIIDPIRYRNFYIDSCSMANINIPKLTCKTFLMLNSVWSSGAISHHWLGPNWPILCFATLFVAKVFPEPNIKGHDSVKFWSKYTIFL